MGREMPGSCSILMTQSRERQECYEAPWSKVAFLSGISRWGPEEQVCACACAWWHGRGGMHTCMCPTVIKRPLDVHVCVCVRVLNVWEFSKLVHFPASFIHTHSHNGRNCFENGAVTSVYCHWMTSHRVTWNVCMHKRKQTNKPTNKQTHSPVQLWHDDILRLISGSASGKVKHVGDIPKGKQEHNQQILCR